MSVTQPTKLTNIQKEENPSGSQQKHVEDPQERETWSNQCEFFLSCLGYAVGFGNVWRFPYLCYKNGGAAFLIPYTIMLFCAGLPLFFMELALGQYISLGPNMLFPNLAPIVSGLGWSMFVVSALVSIYYNMILAWTIFYTFASFTSDLPWGHCDNDFNTEGCFTDTAYKSCALNDTIFYNKTCMDIDALCEIFHAVQLNSTHCQTVINSTTTVINKTENMLGRIPASEDYFKNRMLGLTDKTTWDNLGGMRWELVGCLALAWIIVYFCLIKGVKSSGKVVYFTALFPYAVLLILFIRGVTLEGAFKGIEFYILRPNITKLREIEVWNDAATQIFFSLGSSFGGLITLASYNKLNNNCMRDAIVVALCNCSTSVFAGFVIFSILGFMATQLGVEVKDVVSSGSGLAFVAYPAAVVKMPVPPLWSILFFTMLITLGLDSQFTMVETLTSGLFDKFQSLRSRKPLVVFIVCFVLFLCGLTMCLQGGMYMFELFNSYSAWLSVILVAITEVMAVSYLYGFKKFMNNIQEGMGIKIPRFLYYYWAATWLVITPVSLIIIFAFSLYFWQDVSFDNYTFPPAVQGLGWVICFCSVILIPIFAIYVIMKRKDFGQSWRQLLTQTEDFCSSHERQARQTKATVHKGKPDGVFRYIHNDDGSEEGVTKIYPRIGYTNDGFQENSPETSNIHTPYPPPYSSHI